MTDQALNKGFGECKMEATAKVVAPIDWTEQGMLGKFSADVLAAVHSHNRRAAQGEFIAIDFPGACFSKHRAGPSGDMAIFVGTRAALIKLLSSDRMKPFIRASVPKEAYIKDAEVVKGGYYLARSQASNKATPGDLKRRIRRQEARGKCTEGYKAQLAKIEAMTFEERRLDRDVPKEASVFISGQPLLYVRKQHAGGVPVGSIAMVSTYGFSSAASPVVFDPKVAAMMGVQSKHHATMPAASFDDEEEFFFSAEG